MSLDDLKLDVAQSLEINAAPEQVFNSLLRRFGPENQTPDGTPLPLVLEEKPGGRWYRDLGEDQGHLWGHVQVIKPPTLLEITGPMFMSYPVAGHIQIRLTPQANGTRIDLRHQAFGFILQEHREGVVPGWLNMLELVKEHAEQ